MSSSSSASSSPSKEIFVLSESSSIKLGGNCYKKVPGVFGAETHNVSSITDEYLNCEICEGDLKTVDSNNTITLNKYDQCIIVNLTDEETSQINIYNGKTTTSHKIKNDSGNLILDYDKSTSYTFSNSNKVSYLEIDLLTYKIEYLEDATNKYLCFLEDPFRERCNKKVGVEYNSFKNNSFQKIYININQGTNNEDIFIFDVGSNLDSSLKEIEEFFHKSYLSSSIPVKLKLNSLNNDLMFWKPFGPQITESEIKFSTQNYSISNDYTTIDLSDKDFDGTKDSSDTYPYGGAYAEKIVFSSDDSNLQDFNFGDSIYINFSPAQINTYVIEDFGSIEDSFLKLSEKINLDYENNLNNFYSRAFYKTTTDSIVLEIWDPCSLEAPSSAEIYLVKTSIDLNSENYFSDSSTTDMDGPYTPDGGAFEIQVTPITPTSSSSYRHECSGKYFVSSSTHNSKPVYINSYDENYSVIWDVTISEWRFSKNLSFSGVDYITFGARSKPSFIALGAAIYNDYTSTFEFGLNNAPTYSNGSGYYLFKHFSGTWFLTNGRYGISSTTSHISESTIC
jgi:hypothetical protein